MNVVDENGESLGMYVLEKPPLRDARSTYDLLTQKLSEAQQFGSKGWAIRDIKSLGLQAKLPSLWRTSFGEHYFLR